MSIPIQCECGRKLKARDEFAGTRAECPTCGRTLSIPPAADTAPAARTENAAADATYGLQPAVAVAGPEAGDAMEIVEFLDPPTSTASPIKRERGARPISMRMMF